MRTLNYNHLYYFWTVAREGTIARAAEVLHLTPQTISGQLGEFEMRLETRLFTRHGRRLVLTDVGRMVYDYADNIFRLGNELTDVLQRGIQNTGQRLTVGLVDEVPRLIAHRVISPAFQFDNVVLTCRTGKIDELLADLSIHRLDILLSDTPLSTGLNIRAYNHLLGESGLSFFAAESRAETYRKGFPASLNKAPLLLPTMNSPMRRSLEQWFRKLDIRPVIRGEFEESTLQRFMGEAGIGIFVAPTVIKNEVLQHNRVRCIGDVSSIKESYYLISSERRLKNPAAAAIFDIARGDLFVSSSKEQAAHNEKRLATAVNDI